jgi:signal transduction histidine kinase
VPPRPRDHDRDDRDDRDDRSPLVDRDLFIAVTSHELRTPVTVIKGFADTLVEHWEKLDPAGRRAAVRVISQRADELARLVDRLLAATTEPPGSPLHAPFDLVAALHEAVGELGARLRWRLRMALPPTLPKAYGHRANLDTVLTELITNAMKYSSHPVELSACADDRTVGFQVADRGIGIAPEHIEQAFVRYWQADAGDRREHPGAGLGLYLVRQIVERQNGRVSLRPRPGGGTVAEVRLVRADVAVATDQPAASGPSVSEGRGQAAGPSFAASEEA